MHFNDVKETTNLITKQHLAKFLSCGKRWSRLDGEHAKICCKSCNNFSDQFGQEKIDNFDLEWHYHKTCYKRLCDEEKIRRAEAKSINTTNSKETDDDESSTTHHEKQDGTTADAPCRKLTWLETKKAPLQLQQNQIGIFNLQMNVSLVYMLHLQCFSMIRLCCRML